MFQFKELIEAGKESASHVEQNHANIATIFSALNKELKNATAGKITLICNPNGSDDSYATILAAALAAVAKRPGEMALTPQDSAKKGTLDIALNDQEQAPIARYEQHPDGYPFTIEFLAERMDCWDQTSLVEVLGKIVSSGQFWLKVKELESGPKNTKRPLPGF